MKITKKDVRSEFKYCRDLMRQADEAMKNPDIDLSDAESIALELSASSSVFFCWVEQQQGNN